MDSILQMAERLQDLCEQQRQLLEKMSKRIDKDLGDERPRKLPDSPPSVH